MKNLWTVAEFTIKEMVRRKSFIISTIIILLLIVIGFNVPNIIDSFQNGSDTEGKSTILVLDSRNIYEGILGSLENADNLGYKFQISNEKLSEEQIKSKLDEEEISRVIVISKDETGIKLDYIVKNISIMDAPEEIIPIFTEMYRNLQISKLGLSPEKIASLEPNIEFNVTQTDENAAKRQ